MRGKKDLYALIGAKLDIPREALPFGFALALSGRRELTVWGCEGILAYSEQEICLLVGGRTLVVEGEALLCTAFSRTALTVTGEILAISFKEACDAS